MITGEEMETNKNNSTENQNQSIDLSETAVSDAATLGNSESSIISSYTVDDRKRSKIGLAIYSFFKRLFDFVSSLLVSILLQ